MEYKRLSYSIYSESEDKVEAENTGRIFGKWKLIWFLIRNDFNKDTYSRRKKLEITLEKLQR
jgi:hypothetical protein